jgi:WD40 repeat protein
VAVAGQKQIVLYHAESAQLLGILPFPEGIPYVLRFSRSGALLLAGGGQNSRRGLVAVYDVRTGKRLFEVGDELDVVLAADISPDHSRVALGGPEKIVRVFAPAAGSQLYEIRKHTDWIYAAEFSPDGVLLATADRGGGLLVWEAETGREFHNLEGHKGAVTAVSFRSDSNLLASGSEDGTIVSCGRDRLVKLWKPDGALIRALEPMKELVTRAIFTHNAGRVVAGDWSGEIRMWNAADGKPVTTLKANPGG